MANQILLKRSNVVDASGNPKLPEASAMSYGEIAVNYASGAETLSIKNSNDEIVTFSSDNRSGGGSVSPKYSYGVFIQATDGTLYKTEEWDGTKTPNAIAVLNSYVKLLLSLQRSDEKLYMCYDNAKISIHLPTSPFEINYEFEFKGMTNSSILYNGTTANTTDYYAINYCYEYIFPDGKTHGYAPSIGELYFIFNDYFAIEEALKKCGGKELGTSPYWSSTLWYYGNSTSNREFLIMSYYGIYDNSGSFSNKCYARPIANFPFY